VQVSAPPLLYAALAQKLGPIAPTAPDDETPRLREYEDGRLHRRANRRRPQNTRRHGRDGEVSQRSAQDRVEGGVYMRPTIVLCDSFAHPLTNKEFLCPYASVVQVPQGEMLKQIGYSLAVSAITKGQKFIEQLVEFPEIERLNIGPVSTMKISWDQPHEGNMFEFLYK
jgi:acyl-CoA reductase-like NAD-dependent aldehyde dehydrogenase